MGARILLVEAEPLTRRVALLALRRAGHIVQSAEDADSALRIAGQTDPDVVISSTDIPGARPDELVLGLRARCRRSLPVVGLLGFREDVCTDTAAGFDSVLIKPLDPARLLHTVSDSLFAAPEETRAPGTPEPRGSGRSARPARAHAVAGPSPEPPTAPSEVPPDLELAVELTRLADLAGEAGRHERPADEIAAMLAHCSELPGVEIGLVYRLAGAKPELLASTDADTVLPGLLHGTELLEQVAGSGTALAVVQEGHDRGSVLLRSVGLSTAVLAPIAAGGRILGALVLGFLDGRRTEDRIALGRSAAGMLGSALAVLERGPNGEAHSPRRAIERLSHIAALRDEGSDRHNARVGRYAEVIAIQAGLDRRRAERIGQAAAWHDIGKLQVPEAILRKEGPLNAEEFSGVREHPSAGHRLLSGLGDPILELAATIALTHHERVDGSGYPNGLQGDEIPLEGRITAISDVFDALTSERSYRPALAISEAAAIMRMSGDRHFDSELLGPFLALVERGSVMQGV
ncbi:MAG: HD domain-containing phosphohydrolase [Solirubrobacterales bacterium]